MHVVATALRATGVSALRQITLTGFPRWKMRRLNCGVEHDAIVA